MKLSEVNQESDVITIPCIESKGGHAPVKIKISREKPLGFVFDNFLEIRRKSKVNHDSLFVTSVAIIFPFNLILIFSFVFPFTDQS